MEDEKTVTRSQLSIHTRLIVIRRRNGVVPEVAPWNKSCGAVRLAGLSESHEKAHTIISPQMIVVCVFIPPGK